MGVIGEMEFPLAYVRRIVASTFLADRRRHNRRNTTVQAEPARAVVAPDAHDRLVDRDELDGLLRGLTRSQRVAVVMRFYLDLPDTDIAETLGCSLGNVRSTISRALAALRLSQTAAKDG